MSLTSKRCGALFVVFVFRFILDKLFNVEWVKSVEVLDEQAVITMRITAFYIGASGTVSPFFRIASILLLVGALHYGVNYSYQALLPALSVGVDPGHGGYDPGALGSGLVEKEVNLDVGRRLVSTLEKQGISAFLTRNDDVALGRTQRRDLAARVNAVIQGGADLLVSIHVNSFRSSEVAGPRTYYHPGSEAGRRLATQIQAQLYRTSARGGIRPSAEEFYITQKSPMTAVLVEIGYMTNLAEARQLRTANYRQGIAEAIARGISAYLSGR